MPKRLVISVGGQEHDADDRQQPQDVVLPVRDRRLVRALEGFDDLLVVVQQVPDPLRGVDDVVEVEVEILGQEALDLRSSRRSVGRCGLMILRNEMISCFALEMSRTISSKRPSMSSSIESSLWPILSRIGKQ